MAKRSTRVADTSQPKPGFIFRATVEGPAPTTRGTPSGGIVVRVDEVIASPPALARTAGRSVTVVGAKGLKPGQQAMFEADAVTFGTEIRVRVSNQTNIPTQGLHMGGTAAMRAAVAPLAVTSHAPVDPVQAHRDMLLKRSLDNADVVVAGTVTQVRMAPETEAMAVRPSVATGSASLAAGIGGRGKPVPSPISEHDPLWHEAVVTVQSVEKGTTTQKQVTVRFPGSNDVRWRNHPKLKTGQQGVFLLNNESSPGSGTVVATSRANIAGAGLVVSPVPTAATALQANDAEPISSIQKVRELLGQSVAPVGQIALSAKGRPAKPKSRKSASRSTRRPKRRGR